MTTHKDFKRLVRGRMQKTGESYTAARSHFLRQSPMTPQAPSPDAYARIAGMSDAAVKSKTGCGWQNWVKALDRVEAHTWPHREIAQYVREKYKTPSWWTQTVTVGYERIKGLRVVGQSRGGGFRAQKSKTFAVPVARLYRAFRDGRLRTRWIHEAGLKIRTATPSKSMRISWGDGTSVAVGFMSKGAAKSQVQIEHATFADKATALRTKEYWADRLEVLKDVL
jgi:hypothetical protein